MPYSLTINGEDTAITYASRKDADKAFAIAVAEPSTNWATIVRVTRKSCDVVAFYDQSITSAELTSANVPHRSITRL